VSWLQELIESELLSAGFRRISNGTECISNNGHGCLSLVEKTIGDFIHERGITHTREVSYPDSTFLTDFVVKRLFIEYFGLTRDAEYDIRIHEKINYAENEVFN
jgi:hypothetical protein